MVIDPGHPSENGVGTAGNGLREVHVAWVVAQRLQAALAARGYHVVLTKQSEQEVVTNRRRAQIANDAGAALLIRLHCDTGAGEGYAVYYPDRQGHAHGRVGPSPLVMSRSREAAEHVDRSLAARLGKTLRNNGVLGDSKTAIGSRQGALTGSIFSEVPVVTVEMVVLASAHDAAYIRDPAHQRAVAEALADGVASFVEQRGPAR